MAYILISYYDRKVLEDESGKEIHILTFITGEPCHVIKHSGMLFTTKNIVKRNILLYMYISIIEETKAANERRRRSIIVVPKISDRLQEKCLKCFQLCSRYIIQ